MQPLNELVNQRHRAAQAVRNLDEAIAHHPDMVRQYLAESDRPVPKGLAERVVRMTHEADCNTGCCETYTFLLDSDCEYRVRIDQVGVALYGTTGVTNLPTDPMTCVTDSDWLEWLSERAAQVQVAYLLASNHY